MAVTLKKIDETMVELNRFYGTLKEAKKSLKEDKVRCLVEDKEEYETGDESCGRKESGAVMRASMDLTRALAKFRRS